MVATNDENCESGRDGRDQDDALGRLLDAYRRMNDQFEHWCAAPIEMAWIDAFVRSRRQEVRRESSDIERVRRIATGIGLGEGPGLGIGADESHPAAAKKPDRILLEDWENCLQTAIRPVLALLPMGPAKDLVVRAYVTSRAASSQLRAWPNYEAKRPD